MRGTKIKTILFIINDVQIGDIKKIMEGLQKLLIPIDFKFFGRIQTYS